MEKKFFMMVFLLILSISISFGQVLKLRSTSYAIKYKTDYSWSEWSDLVKTSVLITMDIQKERITIYSVQRQIYDIAEDEGVDINNDEYSTFSFYCIDEDGNTCRIRLLSFYNEDLPMQLYIDYPDLAWVYNVYFLD